MAPGVLCPVVAWFVPPGPAGLVLGAVLGGALVGALFARRLRRQGRRAETQESGRCHPDQTAYASAGLAHEVRNVLSTVKAHLHLLQEDLESAQTSQQLEQARQQGLLRLRTLQAGVERLQTTLDRFLRYGGRLDVRPSACDLNKVVGDLLDSFEPQARESGVRISRNLCPEPLPCRLDEALFDQALLNLLLNAQEAMPQGGEITVRTTCGGRDARLEIADCGPGIAPEDVPRVFDPFYSTKPGGSGLGLPIARRIVQEHGGEIEVHSRPGQGSCFTVRVPLDRPR